MNEVEEIAAKLTEAQRYFVLHGHNRKGGGWWPLRHALRTKGLIDRNAILTPLAFTVRSYLKGSRDD